MGEETTVKKATKQDKPTGGFARFRKDWIEPILIAFILAAIIRSFIIQPFKIPSGSMEDTLLVGDQLMAAKFIYGLRIPFGNDFFIRWGNPKQGDITVFQYPEDPSVDYIKRVVATAGQVVEIRDKQVLVDGNPMEFPAHGKFIDPHVLPAHMGPRDNFGPVTVPDGQMFMMGDNRDNSNDSRFWGYVPYRYVKGKAFIIWWSWNGDVPLYDVLHRVRWGRLFTIIR